MLKLNLELKWCSVLPVRLARKAGLLQLAWIVMSPIFMHPPHSAQLLHSGQINEIQQQLLLEARIIRRLLLTTRRYAVGVDRQCHFSQ
jgi:hypothetical protein